MPIQGSLGSSSSSSFGKIMSKLTASVEYLVIAGGGGGQDGGGGAGGYRTNVVGASSGGTSSAESRFSPSLNQPLTVTVGGGGAAGRNNGSLSVFSTITSIGGGGGGDFSVGANGGSGGGGSFTRFPDTFAPGSGTTGQGTSGSSGRISSTIACGGGGGGAGTSGTLGSGGGNGGNGLSSSITGSPATRGGGGGGGNWDTFCSTCFLPGGSGGSGGGGQGAGGGLTASAGVINTGGGGGGSGCNGSRPCTTSRSGGSGVVILRYPNTFFADFSAGVTQTILSSGSNKVSTITATSTTSETVTFVRALDVSKTYHYINNDVNNPFIVGASYPVGTTLSLYMQLRDVDEKNITNNNQVQSIGFWRSSCVSATSSLVYVGSGIYKIDLQFGGFSGCGAEVMPVSTSMNVEINNIDAPTQSFTIV